MNVRPGYFDVFLTSTVFLLSRTIRDQLWLGAWKDDLEFLSYGEKWQMATIRNVYKDIVS